MKTIELTEDEFTQLLTDLIVLGKGMDADSGEFIKAHLNQTNLIIKAVKRQYEK